MQVVARTLIDVAVPAVKVVDRDAEFAGNRRTSVTGLS
jgi:hypothetical protein